MRINRAIQWAIVLALAPSAGWISSDFARLHDEHDIFKAGGMPSAWWRERVGMDELVARMGKDEAFQSFHGRWTKTDELSPQMSSTEVTKVAVEAGSRQT